MSNKLGAALVAVILAALTGWLALTAAKAPQLTDQMAFLPDTAEVRRFIEINERYHNFDTLLVGVEARDVLEPATLGKLRDLTNDIGKVAGISWMSSLASVPDMKPSDEGVVVEPLVPETLPTDTAGIEALRAQIRGNQSVMGQLVNADFNAALIPVTPYADQVATVAPRVEELARKLASPDFRVVFHGAPAVDLFLERGAEAIPPYGIAAGVVFLAVLLFGLGLRRLPAWLLVVAPSAAAGMVAPVLLGFPASQLSLASGLAAFVFGTLTVFSYPQEGDPTAKRRWWFALLFVAVGLAAVFARLADSPVVPLRGLGVGFAAAALAVALLGPLGLAAGFALVGGPATSAPSPSAPRWGWLAALVPVALAAALVATSRAPAAENDMDATFGPASEPAEAVRFFDGHFGGSDYVTVVMNGDLAHPAFLRAADDLATAFRQVPGVADVVSPTDIFKMISQAMIGPYRIPDTVEQMQALWFFLDGQAELSALMYQREQGLMQVRLTPAGSRDKRTVLGELQRAVNAVPARAAIVDLRTLPADEAGRVRLRQVQGAALRLARVLGPRAAAPVATLLGQVAPLELAAASPEPDAAVRDAWRTRLAQAVGDALTPWLTDGSGPLTLTPEQAALALQALLADAGPAEGRGRAGALGLLRGWFPTDDAEGQGKVAGALLDKARDVQDKVLAARALETLKAAGMADVVLGAEALGVLCDVMSPYVVIDAKATSATPLTETGAGFELTGYPAIAPVLADVTFADLGRLGQLALIVAGLLTVLATLVRRPRLDARTRLPLFALLGAVAWQILWLKGHAWAVDVSSFLAGGVALAAAGGAGLVALTGRSGRDTLAATLLTAGPLLVMALCPFGPVGTVMGLSGIGIAGAALSAWLAGKVANQNPTEAKEETR